MKLGRALGYGARHAAKTVAAVAEAAASAPNTSAKANTAPVEPSRPLPTQRVVSEAQTARSATRTAMAAPTAGALRGRARAVWQPLAVFSGALWLRVTGVFFALIALTLGNGAWRFRFAMHGGTVHEQHRLWIFSGFALLFGYFAVSSFIRANLKERRAVQRG